MNRRFGLELVYSLRNIRDQIAADPHISTEIELAFERLKLAELLRAETLSEKGSKGGELECQGG